MRRPQGKFIRFNAAAFIKFSAFPMWHLQAEPSSPGLLRGICPPCQSRALGHLQSLHCLGAWHLPTPGPFPSFWPASSFLSEYNYTEGFTEKKKKQIGSSVKDRNKLKRVVKACSRFYACISSLLIKQEFIHSKNRSYRCDQHFSVIESNFCWYYLKNILSYL